MKLSIITINYNNCDGLRKTIDSVLAQTCQDFEWIVIDGASTDGSKDLVLTYKEHFSYWCSERDCGIYDAMNKGVRYARGSYVFFLNSGDVFHSSNSIKNIIEQFGENDYIYCNVLNVNPDGTSFLQRPPSNITIIDLVNNNHIHHQGIFVKKEYLINHPFDESFHSAADAEFISYLMTTDAKGQYINEISVDFYTGGLSSSPYHYYEIQRAVLHNLTKSYLPPLYHDIFRLSNSNRLYRYIINRITELFCRLER